MAGDMWKYAVITTKGLLLQSKVATGGTIEFTKTKTGAGMVEPVLLQAQTALTDERQEFSFAAESTVNKETGTVSLVAVIDNDGLQVGYDCYQVGIYATDPDDGEILYAILQSENALAVPAEADMVGWIAEMNMAMQYGNAENVQITMNQAGVISREEYEQHLNNENNPHKVTIEQVCSASDGKLPVQNGGLYINSETTEEDKAEAQEGIAELGYRVKTYTSLSEHLGIEVGSETIESIMSALPSGSILVTGISTANANIFPITGGGTLVVTKSYSNRARFEFWAAASTISNYWIGLHNAGYWSGWIELANASKFLPLDGSVPMSGNLTVNKRNPEVILRNTEHNRYADIYIPNSEIVNIQNRQDSKNYSGFYIKKESNKTESVVGLELMSNGINNTYNIYGEHNVTKGTSALTAGSSALSNGCIYLCYE